MSTEEDDLVSRNFQIVKTVKQRLKLTKRTPLKSEIKKREYITDVRRTYSQMMLNAFNSCDLVKLSRVFELYCRPDLHAVNLYEGGKNPTGSNSTELRSIPTLTAYWDTLFKSAPDFLFESQFVTAYTDKASQVSVIRSKFRMTGTRLLDVKLAQKSNADVIKKKLKQKEKFVVSENDLMSQIRTQLAASCGPVARAPQDPSVVSADVANDAGDVELDGDAENDDFYLDDLILLASDPADMTAEHANTNTGENIANNTLSMCDSLYPPQHLPIQPSIDFTPTNPSAATLATVSTDTAAALTTAAAEDTNTRKRKASARSAAAELKAQTKAEEKAAAKRAKADAAKVTSLFTSGEAVTFSDDVQIYTDKPLVESVELKYRGTFTIYLDENSKIFRYEFIYTAEDVFLAAAEAAAAAAGGGTMITGDSGDSITSESNLSGGGAEGL